jgi:hypothetical protein
LASTRPPLHSQYFVLKWDFSCVNPRGSLADLEKSLFDHVNGRIEAFLSDYKGILAQKVVIHQDNALRSFEALLTAIRQTPYKLYLLIDEYDNFANEIMTQATASDEIYRQLVQKDGPLKTLFKTVKAATAGEGLERIFITGVSPIVMSDITSGYNIAEDIYLEEPFQGVCGFYEDEIRAVLEQLLPASQIAATRVEEAIRMMRTYYNGYLFSEQLSPQCGKKVYNSTLALYFFKTLQREANYPREMLDANLAPDTAKLEYLALATSGRQALVDLIQAGQPLTLPQLAKRFTLQEMLTSSQQDNQFIGSFLYYFGMLTLGGETETGKIRLNVPNLVIQRLYVDHFLRLLLPGAVTRDEGKATAELL